MTDAAASKPDDVTRLVLRRGTVLSLDGDGPALELTVDVEGERRPALSFGSLTGPAEVGDEVIVNTAAVELGLGSGGFDLVHVNLTRGLGGGGERNAHVMKLNYSSLQHAIDPIEERAPALERPLDKPVAVIALHGQLPCVAWAAAKAAAKRTAGERPAKRAGRGQSEPQARVGYVQTSGGALPGALSRVVRELRERGLLCGHVTAGPAFGAEHEAITVAGALHAGLTELGWDAAVAGPGPGVLGSATSLGHGGLAALDSAHAALALGCRTIVVPRMSSGDPRPRHRGLSHHSATVLELLLRRAIVAVPEGTTEAFPGDHELRAALADLAAYRRSDLPQHTMGRSIDEDELFFRAALAGGTVLGNELRGEDGADGA